MKRIYLGIFVTFCCFFVGSNLCEARMTEYMVKGIEYKGLYYNIDEKGRYAEVALAPEGHTYAGNIVIPDSVEYEDKKYPIKEVGSSGWPDFTFAFYNTPNLESVQFGSNLLMYECPFKDSGIREIIFPDEYFCLMGFECENCPNLKELVFNSKFTEFGHVDMPCYLPEIPIKIKGNARINVGVFGGSTIDLGDGAIIFNGSWNELASQNPTNGFKLTGKCRPLYDFITQDGGKWIEFPVLERFEPISFFNSLWSRIETVDDPTETIIRLVLNINDGYKDLEKLICYDPTPWPVGGDAFLYRNNDGTYNPIMYETVTVYVPQTAIATYQAHPVWGKFKTILPIEEAVNDVVVDSDEANAKAPVEFFDMMGRRVTNPRSGELVIRRQGSRTTKMIVE